MSWDWDSLATEVAAYLNEHHFDEHQGVVEGPVPGHAVLFRNDGYSQDPRARLEVELVREGLGQIVRRAGLRPGTPRPVHLGDGRRRQPAGPRAAALPARPGPEVLDGGQQGSPGPGQGPVLPASHRRRNRRTKDLAGMIEPLPTFGNRRLGSSLRAKARHVCRSSAHDQQQGAESQAGPSPHPATGGRKHHRTGPEVLHPRQADREGACRRDGPGAWSDRAAKRRAQTTSEFAQQHPWLVGRPVGAGDEGRLAGGSERRPLLEWPLRAVRPGRWQGRRTAC